MTDQITKLLDDVQRLDEQATQGPWYQGREHREFESVTDVYSARELTDDSHDIATHVWSAEDAEYIALSRTALPKLASVITEILAFVEFAEKTHPENDHFDLAVRSCIRAIKDAIKNDMEDDDGN